MTTTRLESPPDTTWLDEQLRPTPPRRRVRGLRMPVLPSGAWLAQVGGAVTALAGAYLQFGLAATLIAGGVASVAVGALREAGKV
jgi:hypothetical protein